MSDEAEVSSRIFTLANVISVVRLMAIPVFLVLVIQDRLLAAFILLVAAVLTDFVDGMVARRMNQITKLGQFLDPFADRLFIAATVVALAIQGVVPWWFVIAVMLRDALLGIGGIVMSRYGHATLPVKWWGKVATFGLLFVLPLFLLSVMVEEHLSQSVGMALMMVAWPVALVAVVLYWVVGFSYLFDAISLAKEATRERDNSSDRVKAFNEGA
jgi:cardiolipin synthase (CMP-forming)